MYNYPNGKRKTQATNINNKTIHANRGMKFESLINESNDFYALHDRAYIFKKPTPIKVVRVQTKQENFQKKHVISEAYYERASTTDYNGIYKGYYVDFEAKEVKYKTFNIGANLKEHQVEHLLNVSKHGAIAFLLVHFTSVDEVYILMADDLANFLKYSETKSIIPLSYFKENGYLVEQGYLPKIDYLKVVDQLLCEEKKEK